MTSAHHEMVALLKQGEVFGEVALLSTGKRTANCTALGFVDLAVLGKAELAVGVGVGAGASVGVGVGAAISCRVGLSLLAAWRLPVVLFALPEGGCGVWRPAASHGASRHGMATSVRYGVLDTMLKC